MQNRNRRRTPYTGKLDEMDVKFIRHWLSKGHDRKSIAEAFGVRYSHIWNIEHGRAWREIQAPAGAQKVEQLQRVG